MLLFVVNHSRSDIDVLSNQLSFRSINYTVQAHAI